jgi:hypothetical protein
MLYPLSYRGLGSIVAKFRPGLFPGNSPVLHLMIHTDPFRLKPGNPQPPGQKSDGQSVELHRLGSLKKNGEQSKRCPAGKDRKK